MLKDVPTPSSKEAIPIVKSAWPTTWDIASGVVQSLLPGTMIGAVMRDPARTWSLVGAVVVTATLVTVFVLIPAWTATGNTALLHFATFGGTPCSPLHVPAALPDQPNWRKPEHVVCHGTRASRVFIVRRRVDLWFAGPAPRWCYRRRSLSMIPNRFASEGPLWALRDLVPFPDAGLARWKLCNG